MKTNPIFNKLIMKLVLLTNLFLISGAFYPLASITINVPGEFSTIQSAINNASSGDTIIVEPGIYYESIDFKSKGIFLTSKYYLK